MPPRTEAKTRQELIDPALKKASWDVTNHDQVGLEIPVDGFDPQAWKQLETKLKRLKERGASYSLDLPKGISDYALYRPNGEIIAIIEAKRTSSGCEAMSPYIRTTAGQSNIGMEGLGQIPVPLPPLSLQQKFAQVVQKYEHIRAHPAEGVGTAGGAFVPVVITSGVSGGVVT